MSTDPTHPITEEPRREALPSLIGQLAARLNEEVIGRGGLAELRRLEPDHPDRPAFWRLMATVVEDSDNAVPYPSSQRAWALILHGMAMMAPRHHATGRENTVGRVLAETGYAEKRFIRLLRAEPETEAFSASLRTAARWLALKGRPVNWTEMAGLVLYQGDAAEHHRRRLARDYYAAGARASLPAKTAA